MTPVEIFLATTAVVFMGWLIAHWLTKARDRASKISAWKSEVLDDASLLLSMIEQGNSDWFRVFYHGRTVFAAHAEKAPRRIPTDVIAKLRDIASITDAQAANDGGAEEIQKRLKSLISLLRPK